MKRELLRGGPEHISRFPAAVLAVVFAVLLLFWAEFSFVARFTSIRVDGPSMRNTLEDGDWLYADRTLTPARGDIVIINVSEFKDSRGDPVFRNEDGSAIGFIVKRIIAMEGDELYCEHGVVWRKEAGESDFKPLEEPYKTVIVPERSDFPPVSVGAGEIFVMGDNRDVSRDSTEVGVLYAKDILGVVPQWAIDHKDAISRWETFRESIRIG